MNGLLVFLLIVVISAIIGAVSQMMKNAAPPPPPVRRPAGPPGAARPPARGGDDIDRFLEEIDRLRKRKQGGGEPPRPPVARPVARPVPAEPARSPKMADRPAFVPSQVTRRSNAGGSLVEDAPPTQQPRSAPGSDPVSRPAPPAAGTMPRLEDLPVAAPMETGESLVTPAGAPHVAPIVSKRQPTASDAAFARQLKSLLSTPAGPGLAVALREVLGPPKCKRLPGA